MSFIYEIEKKNEMELVVEKRFRSSSATRQFAVVYEDFSCKLHNIYKKLTCNIGTLQWAQSQQEVQL